MKKPLLIVILVLVVLLCIGMFFLLDKKQGYVEPACYDGFTNIFYLHIKGDLEGFNLLNMNETSPEVIAMSKSACGDTKYFTKTSSKLKQASKIAFDDFMAKYNADCSDCLVSYNPGWGGVALTRFSSWERVCDIARNGTIVLVNCVKS